MQMTLSEPSIDLLTATIKNAVAKYQTSGESLTVTDIHLQPCQASGELHIFNDDDCELAHCSIEQWQTYDGDDFDEAVQPLLTQVLSALQQEGFLDNLSIMKPYSFVQVDDAKETVAELLLIDDDTLIMTDELLKGLDDELNTFLKDLLEK